MSDLHNHNEITISDFLYGCAGNYPITEDAMTYVLTKVHMSPCTPVYSISEHDRDLAEIEMLKLILRDAGMTAAMSDANGTWSHKTGAVEMNSTDKKALKEQLNTLLRKYGMQQSSIKFHAGGMRVWQEHRRL